jgi:Xaa-Pro aminopeptidase
VIEAEAPAGAEKPLLAFSTLSLAPIDRKLVEPGLLNTPERAWLDAYHARVRDALTPRLDEASARWLEAATRPIA